MMGLGHNETEIPIEDSRRRGFSRIEAHRCSGLEPRTRLSPGVRGAGTAGSSHQIFPSRIATTRAAYRSPATIKRLRESRQVRYRSAFTAACSPTAIRSKCEDWRSEVTKAADSHDACSSGAAALIGAMGDVRVCRIVPRAAAQPSRWTPSAPTFSACRAPRAARLRDTPCAEPRK